MRGNQPVRLRAHHGMCLAFFRGKGYSEDFSSHMGRIKALLEADPEQVIEVICSTDDICAACPNNAGGICTSEEKVARYDAGVMARLCPEGAAGKAGSEMAGGELTGGEMAKVEMTCAEFARLVRERILAAGEREKICGDCQWSEICH